MDEILQKLLSSELLSEEAKAEISTEWTKAVNQFKQVVREETTVEVRSELAEMWATEKDALVDKVDSFVASKLEEELEELQSDIERFRDLEAEFATKIVEEKHSMAEQLSVELDQLVDKMDAFFELRLAEEVDELREDLEIVKQNEFGRKIFEAYATEFGRSYIDEDSIQTKLTVSEDKLEDAQRTIARLEDRNAKMVRESKLENILAPLSGKKREQMAFVLQNVETSRLEEAYSTFIGRVLKEDAPASTRQRVSEDKSVKALNESRTVVATGDVLQEEVQVSKDDKFAHLRKLAGISSSAASR